MRLKRWRADREVWKAHDQAYQRAQDQDTAFVMSYAENCLTTVGYALRVAQKARGVGASAEEPMQDARLALAQLMALVDVLDSRFNRK